MSLGSSRASVVRDKTGKTIWATVFIALIAFHLLSLALMPIVYDTMHLIDTLFILSDGYRIANGWVPGADYQSFYGGMSGEFLAAAFRMFGTNVYALDRVLFLHACVVGVLAAAVMIRRTGWMSALAIAAVLATCVMTRAPFEEYETLTRPISAHSFSYNRLGLALSIVALLLVLLPRPDDRRLDLLGGFAAGMAIAIAILSKWTFIVVLPPVVLALCIQARWYAVSGVIVGMVLLFLAVDPTGRRVMSSVTYSTSELSAGISGALFKTGRIFLGNSFPIAAVTVGAVLSIADRAGDTWSWIGSLVLMIAGLGAACIVMGPFGLIGHQVVPVAAVLLIVFFEHARRGGSQHVSTQKVLVLVVLAALLLPHAWNTLKITRAGYASRAEVLIQSGPMQGYLQRYSAATGAAPQDVFDHAARQNAEQGTVAREHEYPVFVDGLRALQNLENLSTVGIIADGGMNYEFAVGSRPVAGYPQWPRLTSPELTQSDRLSTEADIVMILRNGVGKFGPLLSERMGTDFHICAITANWEIYSRRTSAVEGCEETVSG